MATEYDNKFCNIILMGISFMFVFTAFQTMAIIEEPVLTSMAQQDSKYTAEAYSSLAIIFGVAGISYWAAPSIVSLIGLKLTFIIGGISNLIFIASFFYPFAWSIYLSSTLAGVGTACLWTAQGNFLTINSNSKTIGRNSGIFWALFQSSLLFGNLFVYLKFNGKKNITSDIEKAVFIALLVVGFIGICIMFFFRTIKTDLSASSDSIDKVPDTALGAFKKSYRLFLSKDLILLCSTFFYSGLELGFWSGVYGSAVSFTKRFGLIANSLVGLSGILIGVGEILGGLLLMVTGSKFNRYGRDPIIILGFLSHMAAFYFIFINLPFSSTFGETYDTALIQSNAYLAMLCSFLLGFGDSCFITQIFSILGTMYPDDSAPAFAVFTFIQCIGATAVFVYSLYLPLQWHLGILAVSATLGTLGFCIVEWKVHSYQILRNIGSIQDLSL